MQVKREKYVEWIFLANLVYNICFTSNPSAEKALVNATTKLEEEEADRGLGSGVHSVFSVVASLWK